MAEPRSRCRPPARVLARSRRRKNPVDFDDLRLFLHLSRSLHFGRTSQECHVSASALSRAIQRLERNVSQQLFDRDNRSVDLTRAGARLQQFASENTGRVGAGSAASSTHPPRACGARSRFLPR